MQKEETWDKYPDSITEMLNQMNLSVTLHNVCHRGICSKNCTNDAQYSYCGTQNNLIMWRKRISVYKGNQSNIHAEKDKNIVSYIEALAFLEECKNTKRNST
jgi:hypothetical protein